MNRALSITASITLAALLSGCNVGPKYSRPQTPAPPAFRGADDAAVTGDAKNSLGDQQWPQVFKDADLQDLIKRALMNNYDVRIAAQHILEQSKYGCALAASTLGPDGVVAYDGKEFWYRPAFEVKVADTTGAGDIFRAGFIYALLQGWPLDRQLDFASAAGGTNCTGHGARGCIAPVEQLLNTVEHGARCAVPKEFLVAG